MDQKKPSGLPHNEFSTPFPGESMMTPVGNLPNDKPPTYPKPNQSAEDALEELNDMCTDRITEPENMKNILNLLKSGKSPQMCAKQYVRSMHMFGTMTNDLALLLEPIVAIPIEPFSKVNISPPLSVSVITSVICLSLLSGLTTCTKYLLYPAPREISSILVYTLGAGNAFENFGAISSIFNTRFDSILI